MSKPMTAAQWRAQLKKWRVPTVYLAGWETRGRPASTAGGPFDDVHGVMIHHTGSDDQRQSYIDWLFKVGRPAEGIPAPLANAMTMMDGRLIMGAIGKANHAGRGVKRILDKVIAETVSLTSEEEPGATGTVNGNPEFYGDEVAFDGGQPMTAAQYDTVVRWCAAICDFHGWSGASVIGHGEWTSAKWDPGQTDMAKLRRDVNALLKAGPGDAPAEPEPPAEPKPLDVLDPANYPDAAHPDRNTTGPQITWLGQCLVKHGCTKHHDGNGYQPGPNWTEDYDRENVRDFQEAQGWTGDDADGYPGPTTLRLLAADPKVTPTKPKPQTLEIPVMLMPLAGYNATTAPGVRRWKSNTDAAIALVKKHRPSILGVTELSNQSKNPMRPRFDAGVNKIGDKGVYRVDGSDGRYVYRDRSEWAVVESGVFEAPKSSLLNGDDKQCAWAVLRHRSGVLAAVGCGHGENQNGRDKRTGKDADDLRVEQVLSWKAQLEAKAVKHGASHVLLMGDFNSRGAVRDAICPKGGTWKASTPGFVVGWNRDRHEAADWMFVSDGEISTSVFNNPGSDHTVLVGVWTITA